MRKLWDKICGECKHIDTSEDTSWGNPCDKTTERKEAFKNKHNGIDCIDRFRHSPTLWIRPGWKACEFFNLK